MAELTPKERRFAELMAVDPERVKWRAAQEAGYSGDEKTLGITAAKVLGRGRIQEHIASIGSQAIDRANAHTERAIADVAECLEFLTTIKRARITDYIRNDGEWDVQKLKEAPAGLMKAIEFRSTTDEDGQAFTSQKVTFESALAATQSLLRHYAGLDAPPSRGVTAEALLIGLASLSDEALLAIRDAARFARAKDVSPDSRSR